MKGATGWSARAEFMERFGSVYEHSPWIAAQVFDAIQNDGQSTGQALDEMDERFRSVVLAAGRRRQLALLNAHPELACAPRDQKKLTADSQNEQSGAGLDHCTKDEFTAFTRLNRQYRERFGFPFIMAVSGYQRQEILKALQSRVANDRKREFSEALEQVCRIGRLRLEKLLEIPYE